MLVSIFLGEKIALGHAVRGPRILQMHDWVFIIHIKSTRIDLPNISSLSPTDLFACEGITKKGPAGLEQKSNFFLFCSSQPGAAESSQ